MVDGIYIACMVMVVDYVTDLYRPVSNVTAIAVGEIPTAPHHNIHPLHSTSFNNNNNQYRVQISTTSCVWHIS